MSGRVREGVATRRKLADALLALADTRDLKKVTVKELCESSNINRQTFYYHFEDTTALAAYALDHEIAGLFGCETIDESYEHYAGPDYCQTFMQAMGDNTRHIRDLVMFLNKQNPRGYFYNVVKRNIEHNEPEARESLRSHGVPEDKLDFMIEVLACAHVALITGWLEGEYDVTPVEMNRVLARKNQAIYAAFTI